MTDMWKILDFDLKITENCNFLKIKTFKNIFQINFVRNRCRIKKYFLLQAILGCISSKFQESYTPQPSGLWLTYGIKRHRHGTMFHGRYAKSFHSFSHTEPTVDTQNNTCAIL
jgi:hypothetical protein